MARKNTHAMLMRNKLGSMILAKASEEDIAKQRTELAAATLEGHIQVALEAGVTPGKIAYMAKKLVGAK